MIAQNGGGRRTAWGGGGSTAISTRGQEVKAQTYRGYPVEDLVAKCRFEEVAYLIWHGDLPDPEQGRRFMERERAVRGLSRGTRSVLDRLPDCCAPIDVLRTAISVIGGEDGEAEINEPLALRARALALMARMPTVVAYEYRRNRGLDSIPPDPDLGFVENFFWMCFGVIPSPAIAHGFETALILHAENGFSPSTFAARVVISTQSDIYGAVGAAIGASKGARQDGGAQAVMQMLLEIGDPRSAEAWVRDALARRRPVAGFGADIGCGEEPCVPIMTQVFQEVAALRHGRKWVEISEGLERTMRKEKGAFPGLEFPTGPTYYLMGFDVPMFISLIAMGRIVGWIAHIIEQIDEDGFIRPLVAYHGPALRAVPGSVIDRAG
ncbi:citrate/2-methylcitrate synthase [Magnetospirillum fulvum]|uniref:citrate synthase (unknown stereospecificity) n=1 Tax=Magnetospirillum fulvum TaxID=1082 RepID=A0A1H6JIM6_MAGFU|nr:citrate/2-methylcitrate synthase [Magnetospirillum fulvum]SEH58986.1 citrate synthase [Magnetospirillum fulvum]